MNQPALGKKIAELRKSKGLTQEELVTKCQLNIRTLQRIESGEVVPRIYTVKAVFAALDYEYDPMEIPEDASPVNTKPNVIVSVTGRIYAYILDLFNLKTNKMKKLTILTAIALCIMFAGTSYVFAQKKCYSNNLVGTWVICNSQGVPMYSKNNTAEFKVITPETFTVLVLNKANKTVLAELMGTYTLKENVYTETITNAHPSMVDFPGTENIFEIEFKGDLLIIQGQNNSYNQTWCRVNPQDLKPVENN